MIVKEGTWISMISFQPVKTRTFRGINAYERFGQSIVNKYKFNSKPYLGMLNLLFLEPANDNAEDQKQNLYNFMIQLRMQLEKQQHNKEYNMFASTPFLHTMLEKILIKQSLYGSQLRNYRNYITQYNVNRTNNRSGATQFPVEKLQFSRPSTRSLTNESSLSVAKALATITVNPIANIGRTMSSVDHQINYHYRKPLIESIWMNQIANKTTNTKLPSLINQFYRATENNQLQYSMSSIKRIVLNHRILKQVYEYGRQHDVIEVNADQQWFEPSTYRSAVINIMEYGIPIDKPIQMISPNLAQSIEFEGIDVVKSITTITNTNREISNTSTNNNTSTIDNYLVTIETLKIASKQYKKQLADSIWTSRIINNHFIQNLERSPSKQPQDQISTITSKNHRMLNRTKNKAVNTTTTSIFDHQMVIEQLSLNQKAFTYMLDYGIEISKPVQLTTPTPLMDHTLEMIDVVKSLTTVVNSTTTINGLASINNIMNRSRETSNNDELLSEIHIISTQYKRQLANSIWISHMKESPYNSNINNIQNLERLHDDQMIITRRNHRMLTRMRTIDTNSTIATIFDQQNIVEQLSTNQKAINYLLDYGVGISKPVQLTVPSPNMDNASDVLDVVKSLTSITNRATIVTDILNNNTITNRSHETIIKYDQLSSEINIVSKQYKRQLADSIWISRMTVSTYNQALEQPHDHMTTMFRRNRRMISRTRTTAYGTSVASIFEHHHTIEQLSTNQRAIQYLIDHGVDLSKPVQLTVPSSAIDNTLEVIDVVKSLTSIVNRATELTTTTMTNGSHMNHVIYDVLSEETQTISKQFKRQLSDSVWISRITDRSYVELLEQQTNLISTHAQNNNRRLLLTSTISNVTSNTIAQSTTLASIFDHQHIVETLRTNRKAIEYLVDYGINMSKPADLNIPTQVANNVVEIMDVVKSITNIVNRTSNATSTYNANNMTSVTSSWNTTRSTNAKHNELLSESQSISKQYHRRLSDSVWISKILDVSQGQFIEQNTNNTTMISRRNKRILHKSMMTVSAEIFDHRMVEERVQANRRVLKYFIDFGVSIEKPIQLVTPIPSMEPEFIEDVVKAISKIEFGNSMTTKSINKYFVQQYRRQLTESVWMKQIHELTSNTATSKKKKTTLEEQHSDSSLAENYLHQLNRTNKRITNQTMAMNVTDIFNNRIVGMRLQHNKIAIQHLHELGIAMNSSVDLLLPNPLRALSEPVNDVVKAVTQIVVALPSINREKTNKVIPLEALRQYRKQLTDSVTTEHHELVNLRMNKSIQNSLRMKANNPIIQSLHQKVSGSVFDPIVIDERIFRDITATRRNSNLMNHTIEQRTDALLSWLLPKSSSMVMTPTAIQLIESNNRTSNRSILRRLQLIRSNYHHMDFNTLETVRAYTSSLFTSTEIDYLNNTISGIAHIHHRTTGRKHNNSSVNLMNTKITWLQGIVDHLVKSTTISNSGSDRLTTAKRKLSNEHMRTHVQSNLVVADLSSAPRQNIPSNATNPISFVHSSPALTLDTLNDELTHRIDQEASLDYLIPKPANNESPPEPTIQSVDLDIQVDQDKVAINPLNNVDMTELVERIYSEIERKMTFERQRRGF